MKIAFVFAIILLSPLSFPAFAQVAVSTDIEDLPIEMLAAALVNSPEAMQNLLPQIIDSFIENPEKFTEIILYLLSSEDFLRTFFKNLPAISEYLPAILLKLPEILSILPQILNEILPHLDMIINNLLAIFENGDDALRESISEGINNVLFLVFDNSNLIIENMEQILSTILSYDTELISIVIRIMPVLPTIIANIDIQSIISFLFGNLPSIEEILKAILGTLSNEELRHLFLLFLQIIPSIPALLPTIFGILAHLLLSQQSIFLIIYSIFSKVSIRRVLSFSLELVNFIIEIIKILPIVFSFENLSFFIKNFLSLIITYVREIGSLQNIGNALKSNLKSNYVLINDMLVPRWLID